MAGYCEIALPVPLRATFTYAVPDALHDLVVPGARVVVPFRNRAMVGIVLERFDRPPASHSEAPGDPSSIPFPIQSTANSGPDAKCASAGTVASVPKSKSRLKNIAEVLDPLPSLPASVMALGGWVAGYYLAPIGETFRAMLPPAVEMKIALEWRITETGRAHLRELQSLVNRDETEAADLALLQLCEKQSGPPVDEKVDEKVGEKSIHRLPGGPAETARLLRRGDLASQQVASRRAPRTQKIVAWHQETRENPSATPIADHPPDTSRAHAADARVERVLRE